MIFPGINPPTVVRAIIFIGFDSIQMQQNGDKTFVFSTIFGCYGDEK